MFENFLILILLCVREKFNKTENPSEKKLVSLGTKLAEKAS